MSKRGENIYKRKDGRWEGRYLKESKKCGYVYGKTYKEAKEKLILAKVNTEKNSNKTHVAVLCDNWLLYKEQYIKESSFVKYKNILEKYVKPYFNRIPVNKIDEYIIEDFAKSLTVKGYSVKTVKITLSFLESVFLYSKINIPFNRLLLKKEQKEILILSSNDCLKFEKNLEKGQDTYKTGILLSLYTGIRIGELCALKRENIDLNTGAIMINATLQRIQDFKGISGNKTKIVITEPKTPSAKRTIPIPDFIVKRPKAVNPKNKSAFLLSGTENFTEPRALTFLFKKCLKESDVTDINFHALRHKFTTRCIENEFEPKALSEILGHSSVNTTLGIYTHPPLEFKRKNINRLTPF